MNEQRTHVYKYNLMVQHILLNCQKPFGFFLKRTQMTMTVVNSGHVKIICSQFEVLDQSKWGKSQQGHLTQTKKGSLPIKHFGNYKMDTDIKYYYHLFSWMFLSIGDSEAPLGCPSHYDMALPVRQVFL